LLTRDKQAVVSVFKVVLDFFHFVCWVVVIAYHLVVHGATVKVPKDGENLQALIIFFIVGNSRRWFSNNQFDGLSFLFEWQKQIGQQ
jgi:hypothetical protein